VGGVHTAHPKLWNVTNDFVENQVKSNHIYKQEKSWKLVLFNK